MYRRQPFHRRYYLSLWGWRGTGSGQCSAEPVGELAGGARVQVALGRGDPRVAHRGLDGREIDAASDEQ
jgi:hypothetical protein